VRRLAAAEAFDLRGGNHAPVGAVPLGPDPSLPVPPAERVETDPQ
jgi:hypothetical protein